MQEPVQLKETEKRAYIKPTVGRVVWYKPLPHEHITPSKSGNCAAIIAEVHSDRCVNLTIFDANGNSHARTSITLIQEVDPLPAPDGGYCTWMPYQKGQAARTEQLEQRLQNNQSLLDQAGKGSPA